MTNQSDRHTFHLLTEFLQGSEPLWRERPFAQAPLSWEESHPHFVSKLLALKDDVLDEFEECPHLLSEYHDVFKPICHQTKSLAYVKPIELSPMEEVGPYPPLRQVPERKRVQIEHFTRACSHLLGSPSGHWAEWCSGKGHLGRALLRTGCESMLSIERNEALISKGRNLAAQEDAHQSFLHADVLKDSLTEHLPGLAGLASLHACGVLTDKVLEVAVANEIPSVFASPCCYHAGVGKQLTLRSREAQTVPFSISGEELRLVTAEVVVARQSLRKGRVKQMGWRLALDTWVREQKGVDEYIPQGSFSSKETSGDFKSFMSVACPRMGVSIPTGTMALLEREGHERAGKVRRLALIRGLFRRVLEKWINLDRVLHLQEQGRHAFLRSYCARVHSPRNHLIVGQYR